jgi:hypothetical protein
MESTADQKARKRERDTHTQTHTGTYVPPPPTPPNNDRSNGSRRQSSIGHQSAISQQSVSQLLITATAVEREQSRPAVGRGGGGEQTLGGNPEFPAPRIESTTTTITITMSFMTNHNQACFISMFMTNRDHASISGWSSRCYASYGAAPIRERRVMTCSQEE